MAARTALAGGSLSLPANTWTDVTGAQPAANEEWSVVLVVVGSSSAFTLEFRLTNGSSTYLMGGYSVSSTAAAISALRGLKVPNGYKMQVRAGSIVDVTIGISATTRSTA